MTDTQYAKAMTVEETIEHMRAHGQSLTLNWGEDTGMWEVSWITGGQRFTGVSTALWSALGQAKKKAEAVFGMAQAVYGAAAVPAP